MLLTKDVELKWCGSNKSHYINKCYIYTNIGDKFKVKVEDLTNSSTALVEVKCDNINCNNNNSKFILWKDYLKCLKDNGKYYCRKCIMKLSGTDNYRKTRLKNGKSFEQWCIDYNYKDILDRWDYELNDCKPSEITFSIGNKFYFKCPQGIHKSELNHIANFTHGSKGVMYCKQCNSFAQYSVEHLDHDFLEKYWDWDKNIEIGIDPWKISYSSNKKVYIKCQEKDYHGSYPIQCNDFTDGSRCPYCNSKSGKVHPLDSLGTLYPEVLNVWSDKNKKSPYEYTMQEVYWKCSDRKHKDYKRNICDSNNYDFRCPKCKISKGEKYIENILISNNFLCLSQKEYNNLYIIKDNYEYCIIQKKFYNLRGLGNGLLSYDFYIPNLNLLIEFHGEQHERYCKGFHKSYEDFKKQLEHDQRKCIYALNNNINLLIIWYWDFDNIEKILLNILNN